MLFPSRERKRPVLGPKVGALQMHPKGLSTLGEMLTPSFLLDSVSFLCYFSSIVLLMQHVNKDAVPHYSQPPRATDHGYPLSARTRQRSRNPCRAHRSAQLLGSAREAARSGRKRACPAR